MKAWKAILPGIGWGALTALLVTGAFLSAGIELYANTPTPAPVLPTPNLTPIILPNDPTLSSPSPTFDNKHTCPIPPGWQPHIVQPGETLNNLAGLTGISAEQIMAANCMVSPGLLPETILYLPAPTATVPAHYFASPTPTGCAPPPGWILYRVQRGDTLTRIGGLYGVTAWLLKQTNCLESDVIVTGQYLWVPNVATRTYTPTSTPQPEAPRPTVTPIPASPTPVIPSSTPTLEPTSTPTPTPVFTPSPTESPTPTPINSFTETPTVSQTETFPAP